MLGQIGNTICNGERCVNYEGKGKEKSRGRRQSKTMINESKETKKHQQKNKAKGGWGVRRGCVGTGGGEKERQRQTDRETETERRADRQSINKKNTDKKEKETNGMIRRIS